MLSKWSKNQQRFAAFMLGTGFVVLLLTLAERNLSQKGYKPAYQSSSIGGWMMTPNADGRRMQSPHGHDFYMTTNADGLRGSVKQVKDPKRFRIAVLGDSTVFGWGVNDADAFPVQLEKSISEYLPSVEILNAAQPGHSSTQATKVFTEIVQHYQPDLSILFLPDHDHNRVLVSDREVLRGGQTWLSRVRVFLARRSLIYSRLRLYFFPKAQSLWVFPDQEYKEPRVPRVSDTERDENVEMIRTTAAKWSGRLWLGLFPGHYDLEHEKGAPPVRRFGSSWIEKVKEQDSTPILDLRDCCDQRASELVLPYDKGHLNATGCREVANLAAKKLRPHLLSPDF